MGLRGPIFIPGENFRAQEDVGVGDGCCSLVNCRLRARPDLEPPPSVRSQAALAGRRGADDQSDQHHLGRAGELAALHRSGAGQGESVGLESTRDRSNSLRSIESGSVTNWGGDFP